jgi:acyl-CoA dehydrogenase
MAHSTGDLFADAVRQLLTAQCTPQVVRDVEAGQSAQPLWQLIEASGFADALVGEAQGGAGLSLPAVYPVFELCGTFAMPVPLAETMLARALLAQAGVAVPPGSVVMVQADASPSTSPSGSVVCGTVHGGQVADWVLVTQPALRDSARAASQGSPEGVPDLRAMSLLLPTSQATKSAAGFCLDAKLEWSEAVVAKALRFPCDYSVKELQAGLYAAQLAGAMQAVFSRTLQYANDRSQFGRPIGKFQAIQHQLSVMAEHAFAARMAAQMGCRSGGFLPERLCVAVAKARTSEAAVEVAALSHSIHGAIGFTQAFDLQLCTRRLHMWRQAGGSESYWHTVLGEALVDQHHMLALDLIRHVTDTA